MSRRLLLVLCTSVVLTAGCASTSDLPPPAMGASTDVERVVNVDRSTASAVIEPVREPWSFGGFDGERITTPHYVLHTTTDNDLFRDRLGPFYEALLDECRTAFTDLPAPRRPMETYIFQDRRQWMGKTREVLGSEAGAFRTLGRGGFTKGGNAVLYYLDGQRSRSSRDTFALAAHEGWHQYTQATFRHHLPVWLEEGLATYMEAFRLDGSGRRRFQPERNTERWKALRDAVRANRLIPMDQLLTRTPQEFLSDGKTDLLVYYAQVWALSQFLTSAESGRYREGLEDVLNDAADGRLVGRLFTSPVAKAHSSLRTSNSSRSGAAVILVYFNPDLHEFEQQFISFVQQLTAPMDQGSASGSRE